MHELGNKRRISITGASQLLANTLYSHRGMGLSMGTMIAGWDETKCPFEAIQIINLPKGLDKDTTHRYGPNTFKLHRLPVPRPGQVLGLVSTNGIGKSTALKVLAGKLKPNPGRFTNAPDWQEILTYFRGSELQNYFTRILEDNLKSVLQAIIKPQYVNHIPKAVEGNVGEVLEQKDKREMRFTLAKDLDLNRVNFKDSP